MNNNNVISGIVVILVFIIVAGVVVLVLGYFHCRKSRGDSEESKVRILIITIHYVASALL